MPKRKSQKTHKSPALFIIAALVVGIVFLLNQFTSSQALHSNSTTTQKSETIQLSPIDASILQQAQQPSSATEELKIDGIEIPAKIPNRSEIFITHTGFALSYNPDWKIPNWVAYELTDAEVSGEEPRSNRFMPDPNLTISQTATDNDYKNSGWDRGHMAPAADMKWSKQAMKESFYFSNICPQNRNLNAGVWNNLEEQVRALASQKGSIYVVCGPIVDENPQTIGANNVVVPQRFFKALLQNNTGNWYAIGFVFDNKSGKRPLSTYALSVSELQEITGITFFPSLPKEIAENVKSEVDFSRWTVTQIAKKTAAHTQ